MKHKKIQYMCLCACLFACMHACVLVCLRACVYVCVLHVSMCVSGEQRVSGVFFFHSLLYYPDTGSVLSLELDSRPASSSESISCFRLWLHWDYYPVNQSPVSDYGFTWITRAYSTISWFPACLWTMGSKPIPRQQDVLPIKQSLQLFLKLLQ